MTEGGILNINSHRSCYVKTRLFVITNLYYKKSIEKITKINILQVIYFSNVEFVLDKCHSFFLHFFF